MKAKCCLLVLLLAALMTAATTSGSEVTPFLVEHIRCLRPFSSVETFASVTKTPKEQNCDFYFYSATKAAVSLSCEGEQLSRSLDRCNVTMTIDMSVPSDVAERLAERMGDAGDAAGPLRAKASDVIFDQDDLWRYEFQIAALEDGTAVNYKGFSGDGYSLCCDGMTTGAANCPWIAQDAGDNDLAEEDVDGVEETPPQRRLMRCPLPLPPTARQHHRTRDSVDTVPSAFVVRIAKPLPYIIPGPWEARLQLSRKRAGSSDREDLGRVIVAFLVQPEQLWAGGHVRALTPGADAVVAVTTGNAKADEDL